MPKSRIKIKSAWFLVFALAYSGLTQACSIYEINVYNPEIIQTKTGIFAARNVEDNNISIFKVGKDLSVKKLWGIALLNIGNMPRNSGPKIHLTNNGLCVIEENQDFIPQLSGEEVGLVFYCEGFVKKVYKVKDLVNLNDPELNIKKIPKDYCNPELYEWKTNSEFTGYKYKVDVAGGKTLYFNPYDGEILCEQYDGSRGCQAKGILNLIPPEDFKFVYQFAKGKETPEEIKPNQIELLSKVLRSTGDTLVINSKSDDTYFMDKNNKIAKARAMFFYNMLVSNGVPETQISVRVLALVNKFQDKASYKSESSMRRVEFLTND